MAFVKGGSDLKKQPLHIPISDLYLMRIQQLCLCMTAFAELLYFIFGSLFSLRIVFYRLAALASTGLFSLATLPQMRRNKTPYPFRLAPLMALWFGIVCILHRTDLTFTGDSLGLFLCVYLVALPFAQITRDENRKTGLKIMGLLFVSVSLIWTVYGVLLILDRLPAPLQGCVAWDGVRLQATLHPNVCARVFLIGIAFCVCLCLQARTKWMRGLSLAFTALIFAALSLTNSRSAILAACMLVAGTVFFLIHRGGRKRLVAGCAAALGVCCLLFLTYQFLFSWNTERLISQWSVSQSSARETHGAVSRDADLQVSLLSETDVQKFSNSTAPIQANGNPVPVLLSEPGEPEEFTNVYNPQGTFLEDLFTLNNRTGIWHAALEGIRETPSILLFGTDNPGSVVEKAGVEHSHNAWLEVLLRLGLPGLLLSLIFTAQALQSSLLLLCSQVEIWKKTLALLTLCLLLCSLVEPSLFFSKVTWHFQNYLFFLLLGYLRLWYKQIPLPKAGSTPC